MTELERKATRKRLLIWQEAGELLEAQRWRELRALTPENSLRMTRALLSREVELHPGRPDSGLVQQQALFQRLRRR